MECPYCGEFIADTAKKCRYCGEWLLGAMSPHSPASTQEQKTTQAFAQTPASTGQPDNASKDSPEWSNDVTEGCFGCLASVAIEAFSVLFVVLCIGALLHYTIPSDERMLKTVREDVVQCVADEAADWSSLVSDELSGLVSLFMDTGVADEEILNSFDIYNDIEIDKGLLWTIAYVYNEDHPDGELAAFGMLGITLPLLTFEDFSLTGNSPYNHSEY